MNSAEALALCLQLPGIRSVLDIGSGQGLHAHEFRCAGKMVSTVNLAPPCTYLGGYLSVDVEGADLIWASHVLEHQPDVGAFLRKCRMDLNMGGWLAVTVPPMKDQVVGGHVALFNAGTLLYNLILAGFDCSQAKVKTYGYNVSVVVQKREALLPPLHMDEGDIERLSHFFPIPVMQGFDGRIESVNWSV